MSWPAAASPTLLHRLVDTQAILRIEQGGRALIDAWQAQRWRELQDWLRAHSPAWRERLSGGDWRAPHDWPMLSRETLQALVARDGPVPVPPHHGPLRQGNTSGSSGIALNFFSSAFSERLMNHNYAADDVRQGRHPLGVRAVIDLRVHASSEPPADAPRPPDDPGPPLFTRRISESGQREHAQWLMDLQPRYLSTYPHWLQWLLEEARAQGWPLPRIEQVMTLGATITEPLRQISREMLGAELRDRYSCEEVGPLAFQCPRSDAHYHVAVTNVRLEVVDDAGRACAPGVPGHVLVTGLHQYATPIVRYELGDVAALHPACPGCGADIAALSSVLGRRRALLRLPDGRLLFTRTSASDWIACAPVREHRLVQTTEQDVVAEVVVERPLLQAERDAIVRMLQRDLSPLLNYHVRETERIERTASNTRQDFVSLIL